MVCYFLKEYAFSRKKKMFSLKTKSLLSDLLRGIANKMKQEIPPHRLNGRRGGKFLVQLIHVF
jgi:hypothetical protein